MEFLLLGDVEARVDGDRVEVGHGQLRCVLAALLVDVHQPVSVGQLLGVEGGDDFAVMDVATGKVRWRLRDHDTLPADDQRRLGGSLPSQWPVTVVGDGADWIAIVPCADAQGQGAAALSDVDGSVAWTLPVVPNSSDYHYVAAADENIVVSLVSSVPRFEFDRTRIVATRIADKAKAWEAADEYALVGNEDKKELAMHGVQK